MTTHISKEELALMLPGTMYHYFKDEPDYVVAQPAPRPGLLTRLRRALAGWLQQHAEMQELANLSDAQLADIGISRAEASKVFDPDFAARRNAERFAGVLHGSRAATA